MSDFFWAFLFSVMTVSGLYTIVWFITAFWDYVQDQLNELDDEDDEDDDDNHCRTCGDIYADGSDGFDGECPDCADKTDRRLYPENYVDG